MRLKDFTLNRSFEVVWFLRKNHVERYGTVGFWVICARGWHYPGALTHGCQRQITYSRRSQPDGTSASSEAQNMPRDRHTILYSFLHSHPITGEILGRLWIRRLKRYMSGSGSRVVMTYRMKPSVCDRNVKPLVRA